MGRRAVIAAAAVAFVAIAVLLARWLSAEGAERGQVTDLIEAQARGDAAAMLAELDGCAQDPACAATVRDNARRLGGDGDGDVEIVAYDSSTAYALGSASGPTRVVWRTPGRLTTVQCVQVRREGDPITGPSVALTGIGAPIGRTAAC